MAFTPLTPNGSIESVLSSGNELLMFVNIKKSFFEANPSSIYFRKTIFDCTRKYWKLNSKKVNKIAYVLGHVNGIVQCVIKPTRWEISKEPETVGRFICFGEELMDSPFLGKDITNIISIGQNPVNYYEANIK